MHVFDNRYILNTVHYNSSGVDGLHNYALATNTIIKISDERHLLNADKTCCFSNQFLMELVVWGNKSGLITQYIKKIILAMYFSDQINNSSYEVKKSCEIANDKKNCM